MKTSQSVLYGDARSMMAGMSSSSADLVVTSPPYPMIEMWDETFSQKSRGIGGRVKSGDGDGAFELMHEELDPVWGEAYRLLRPGGIACINIGDATRRIGGSFRVFPNHARVLTSCVGLGFEALPEIIWRKQSNKPTKFMGSGMLPGAAYVTQEHEYVLVLRKGPRPLDTPSQRLTRRRSAFFWEERNLWFSDVWEGLQGDRQRLGLNGARGRSAAFPFELGYRLISMFSVQNGLVLDPFLGTGTTMVAAMAAGRDSVGIELDPRLRELVDERVMGSVDVSNAFNERRISDHRAFVARMRKEGRELRYVNKRYGFPVMTGQETLIRIPILKRVDRRGDGRFEVRYR
ncbi:MAG: site-specific DNA-methyltransferase [Thaumarchaeota archaeon]|nr:site-specific DNA-methyltransferase [Nitrososphaerota archaeon]